MLSACLFFVASPFSRCAFFFFCAFSERWFFFLCRYLLEQRSLFARCVIDNFVYVFRPIPGYTANTINVVWIMACICMQKVYYMMLYKCTQDRHIEIGLAVAIPYGACEQKQKHEQKSTTEFRRLPSQLLDNIRLKSQTAAVCQICLLFVLVGFFPSCFVVCS